MKWKLWVDYFQKLSPHPSAVQRCIFCSPIKLIQFPKRNVGGNLTKSGFCPSLTDNGFPGQFEFSNLATITCMVTCTLDRFKKTFFWNFQSIQADLCYILIYKQMLEKVFCSNIAPSLSSGNHLFYKAEYMGQSCPNQVWAITFDWGALAT